MNRLTRPLTYIVALSLLLSTLPVKVWAQTDATSADESPGSTETTAIPWLINLTTDKRILETPFNKAEPEKSTATVIATVTDRNTGNPVTEVKVFFSSGNVYFPDTTGQVNEKTAWQTTDQNGEARTTYATTDSSFEDIIDLYATTFVDQENLGIPVYSHPFQIVNNNPEIITNSAVENIVAAEEQLTNLTPSTGGEEPRDINDLMNEVAGQDGLKVEMDAKLGASDNSNGEKAVAIQVDLRAAASQTLAEGSTQSPNLGLLRLEFSGAASDQSETAASFQKTQDTVFLSFNRKSDTPDTGAGGNKVLTWGADRSAKNILQLNDRAWGERDLNITVKLISRLPINKELVEKSAIAVEKPESGSALPDYVLAQQTLVFHQSNPDQPQIAMEIQANPDKITDISKKERAEKEKADAIANKKKYDPSKIGINNGAMDVELVDRSGGKSNKIAITGRVLVNNEASQGTIIATVTSSDKIVGTLEGVRSARDGVLGGTATDPILKGQFTFWYVPKLDSKSREITINIEAKAAALLNNKEYDDIPPANVSIIIHQGPNSTSEDEESQRVLIDQVTDGYRTVSVYGDRTQAAFGAITPYRTHTSKGTGMSLAGGGLFSMPTLIEYNTGGAMSSSGTRISDLYDVEAKETCDALKDADERGLLGAESGTADCNNLRLPYDRTISKEYYVPLLVEVTEGEAGSPAQTGAIRGRVNLTNENVKGGTHLLAAEGTNEEYFFGGGYRDEGGIKLADLTAQLGTAGYTNFYYAPGSPENWDKVRKLEPNENGAVDTGHITLSHTYINPKTGRKSDLFLNVDIDVLKDAESVTDVEKREIKLTPLTPLAWDRAAAENFGGLSYTELVDRLKEGNLSSAEKKIIEEQVAWVIQVQVVIPEKDANQEMPKLVALKSYPEGQWLKIPGINNQSDIYKLLEGISSMEDKNIELINPPTDDNDDGWLFKPLPDGSFEPQPLNATLPGEIDQIKDPAGWFSLELTAKGEGAAAFIPAVSPRHTPTTINAWANRGSDAVRGAIIGKTVLSERGAIQKGDTARPATPKPINNEITDSNLGIKVSLSTEKDLVKPKDKVVIDYTIKIPGGVGVPGGASQFWQDARALYEQNALFRAALVVSPGGLIFRALILGQTQKIKLFHVLMMRLVGDGVAFTQKGDIKRKEDMETIGPLGMIKDSEYSSVYYVANQTGQLTDKSFDTMDPDLVYRGKIYLTKGNSAIDTIGVKTSFARMASIKDTNKDILVWDLSWGNLLAFFARGLFGKEVMLGLDIKIGLEGVATNPVQNSPSEETKEVDQPSLPTDGYTAELIIPENAVAINRKGIATVKLTRKGQTTESDPDSVIQVDFEITEGPAIFDNGKKTHTGSAPIGESVSVETKFKTESDKISSGATATIKASYRIEPEGQVKTPAAEIGSKIILFGAAEQGEAPEDNGNNSSSGGESGGWGFDPNKPLLPNNTRQSLDNLNTTLQNSQYLSDSNKNTIRSYITELKNNPDNWQTIVEDLRMEIYRGTKSQRNNSEVKKLWTALGDTTLDLMNQEYRNDPKKSEADRRELDQAIQRAKQGDYDPLIIMSRSGKFGSLYPGYPQAKNAYTDAGVDMLNPTRDYSSNDQALMIGNSRLAQSLSGVTNQVAAFIDELFGNVSGAQADTGAAAPAPRINFWQTIWGKIVSWFNK